jgi:hypothetical protein
LIQLKSACGLTGPAAPANPTGNPVFNLKKRPEVKKSGQGAYKYNRNNADGVPHPRDQCYKCRRRFLIGQHFAIATFRGATIWHILSHLEKRHFVGQHLAVVLFIHTLTWDSENGVCMLSSKQARSCKKNNKGQLLYISSPVGENLGSWFQRKPTLKSRYTYKHDCRN